MLSLVITWSEPRVSPMPTPKLYSRPPGSVAADHREDVVLLLVQRIDVVDQADAAVELDAGRAARQ